MADAHATPTQGLLPQTASQTIGPFFYDALVKGRGQHIMVETGVHGQRIALTGHVLDGNDDPIDDAMIEIWQADAHGHFRTDSDPGPEDADTALRNFGRARTDDDGVYTFQTVKPGKITSADGEPALAPHIDLRVFARGLLVHVTTRVFFADEETTEADPVFASVPAERRATLLARPGPADGDVVPYTFDIHMQGEHETVFFEP